MAKCMIELTARRRDEALVILSRLGPGTDRCVKARALSREMQCKPTFGQACSLLGQLNKPVKRRARMQGHYRRPTNEERFEAMKKQRPDLY